MQMAELSKLKIPKNSCTGAMRYLPTNDNFLRGRRLLFVWTWVTLDPNWNLVTRTVRSRQILGSPTYPRVRRHRTTDWIMGQPSLYPLRLQ
jgi:hypothetical protein